MNPTHLRRLTLVLAFLLVIPAVDLTAAQNQKQPDQTYVIEGTPDRITVPALLCLEARPNTKTCDSLRPPSGFSQAQVVALLEELLKDRGGIKDGIYYVMHLAAYGKGEPANRSDAWY